MIGPEQLVAILGRPFGDSIVELTLEQFKIRRRPTVELDEENIDGPVIETQDWLINRRMGIEFGFEDEAAFLDHGTTLHGDGPMLLTQIYFYGDHEEVQSYGRLLPFGLTVNDDRETVRAKLATWEGTRRSYMRDTWELPDFRMTVSYVDDAQRIGFVLCALRQPPLECDDGALLPNTEQILSVLGKPLSDHEFQRHFAPFGLPGCLEDRGNGRIGNFRKKFGLELQFSDRESPGSLVLSTAFLFRNREMDACRWPGSLPYNLSFDDSPELLLLRISTPPNEQIDEMFVGFALWHFSDYSIQVKSSTMENWISFVRLLAPGVWDAS